MLAAADGLFADTDSPHTVSMDAIAVAAGVGKGTLFRAFGNRDGLLDALWAAKLTTLREAVEAGEAPLGPGAPARERVIAFLDALLTFKLENRQLIRAREMASTGVRKSEHYRWMQGLLEQLLEDAAPETEDAGYAAGVLLSALHIDLIEELLAAGRSPREIRRAQAALARAVMNDTQHD
ncbi:MAG TPA: helix-turn-helix domain-containing protein [Amycolatopsis sp.]|nr:helix-turn-helix domain-containing protein [Amycolatopsis sp.]